MYEISSISCLAIKEVLKNYKIINKYISQTNQGKKYLIKELNKLKLKNFKTYSNFILVDFENKDLSNDKYHLINVWASWCLPCKKEHPILMKLSQEKNLKIFGVNFKDKKIHADQFLKELGNPYAFIGKDINGKQSVRFGIYGIPESILINKNLLIMKKFVGPLSSENLNQIVEIIN